MATGVTRPIRCLVKCIGESEENRLKSFDKGGIAEVDRLYEALDLLTEKQREKKKAAKAGRHMLIVRAGGDEVMVWLSEYTEKECRLLLENIQKKTDSLFPGRTFEIQVSMGYAVSDGVQKDYTLLLHRAEAALAYAKWKMPGKAVAYQKSMQMEKQMYGGFNEIASVSYVNELNIVF